MIANRSGKIINLGAGVLEERAQPGIVAYCASKAGIINFTRHLAAEVRRHKITSTPSIRRGADGDGGGARGERGDEAMARAGQTVRRDPRREVSVAEEVAPLVIFLASDESRMLTGRFLQVSSQANPYYLQL